jgi:hypothetical protein
MSVFDHYGMDHLSPSSCNLFAAAPALWVMERVLKKTGPVGAAAHRGSAVEAGIIYGLQHPGDPKAATAEALNKFSGLTALSGDPRLGRERDGISDMVRQGLIELGPYGKPSHTQGLFTISFDNLSVPIIGYYDAAWDNHKVLTDIKTTHKMPNEVKTPHARQVALYWAGFKGEMDPRLTYVTPRKAVTYRLDNPQEHLDALANIARTIERFLGVSKDPHELAALLVPDVDSFYFNEPATKQMAFEVWGL